MEQIDTNKAVAAIGNRFELVLIAAVRARELKRNHAPKVKSTSNNIVTALKEIEEGHIGREYLKRVKTRKNPK